MAIYSRFGEVVTIARRATLAEVRAEWPERSEQHCAAMREAGALLVVRFGDGAEQLSAAAYLRADNASHEIEAAARGFELAHFDREDPERFPPCAEGYPIAQTGYYLRPIEADGTPTGEWFGPFDSRPAALAATAGHPEGR